MKINLLLLSAITVLFISGVFTTRTYCQYTCDVVKSLDPLVAIKGVTGTPDGQILIAVGEKKIIELLPSVRTTTQYIIRSSDAGKTWNEIEFPNEVINTIPTKLSDVSFIKNDNTLIAVGDGSRYYFKSTDIGLTWEKVLAPEYFFWRDICVSPTNPNNAIVWGGYVRFITTDGGDTWKPLFKNQDNDMLSIYASTYAGSSIQLVMDNALRNGFVHYHSTDNGNTWKDMPFEKRVNASVPAYFPSTYFKGDTSIMVFATANLTEALYRETFDGGKTFNDRYVKCPENKLPPSTVAFFDSKTAISLFREMNSPNQISTFMTTNAGETWEQSNFPRDFYLYYEFYKKTVLPNGDLYVYDVWETYRETNDGPKSAILKLRSSPDTALQACAFTIYPEITANGYPSGLHRIGWNSSKGATHYHFKLAKYGASNYDYVLFKNNILTDIITTDTTIQLYFLPGSQFILVRPIDSINTYKKGYWALGYLHFYLDLSASVIDEYINIRNDGSSPNPTSGECTVNMVVNPDVAKSTTLKLYSTLGREVLDATSAIEIKPDATATARISLAGLPDGLYLCVLNDGKRTDTKNILLIK